MITEAVMTGRGLTLLLVPYVISKPQQRAPSHLNVQQASRQEVSLRRRFVVRATEVSVFSLVNIEFRQERHRVAKGNPGHPLDPAG
jgi:hypothetical protein